MITLFDHYITAWEQAERADERAHPGLCPHCNGSAYEIRADEYDDCAVCHGPGEITEPCTEEDALRPSYSYLPPSYIYLPPSHIYRVVRYA